MAVAEHRGNGTSVNIDRCSYDRPVRPVCYPPDNVQTYARPTFSSDAVRRTIGWRFLPAGTDGVPVRYARLAVSWLYLPQGWPGSCGTYGRSSVSNTPHPLRYPLPDGTGLLAEPNYIGRWAQISICEIWQQGGSHRGPLIPTSTSSLSFSPLHPSRSPEPTVHPSGIVTQGA